jgi:GT2 family glycosyltransferase
MSNCKPNGPTFNGCSEPVELVAVMNSFNRLPLLSSALPSLISALQQLPIQSAVIVMDVGSTDGSVEFVESLSRTKNAPYVSCIKAANSTRPSFSEACNLAVEYASKCWSELRWVLFFETDNQFRDPLALSSALDFLRTHPKIGAVGFRVTDRNDQPIGFGIPFPSLLEFAVGQRLAALCKLNSPRLESRMNGARWSYCDVVFTSPLLVRLEAWHATGGMDAVNFPFCDSDCDWCWSAYRCGWRCAVLDRQGVVHDNHGLPSAWSATRVLNFHQARFRLLVKQRHVFPWVLKMLLFIRHAIECILLIPGAVLSNSLRRKLKQRRRLLTTVRNGYS